MKGRGGKGAVSSYGSGGGRIEGGGIQGVSRGPDVLQVGNNADILKYASIYL